MPKAREFWCKQLVFGLPFKDIPSTMWDDVLIQQALAINPQLVWDAIDKYPYRNVWTLDIYFDYVKASTNNKAEITRYLLSGEFLQKLVENNVFIDPSLAIRIPFGTEYKNKYAAECERRFIGVERAKEDVGLEFSLKYLAKYALFYSKFLPHPQICQLLEEDKILRESYQTRGFLPKCFLETNRDWIMAIMANYQRIVVDLPDQVEMEEIFDFFVVGDRQDDWIKMMKWVILDVLPGKHPRELIPRCACTCTEPKSSEFTFEACEKPSRFMLPASCSPLLVSMMNDKDSLSRLLDFNYEGTGMDYFFISTDWLRAFEDHHENGWFEKFCKNWLPNVDYPLEFCLVMSRFYYYLSPTLILNNLSKRQISKLLGSNHSKGFIFHLRDSPHFDSIMARGVPPDVCEFAKFFSWSKYKDSCEYKQMIKLAAHIDNRCCRCKQIILFPDVDPRTTCKVAIPCFDMFCVRCAKLFDGKKIMQGLECKCKSQIYLIC